MSLTTGVHRDIWYVWSVIRSLRGTVYVFFLVFYSKHTTMNTQFTSVSKNVVHALVDEDLVFH